MPPTDRERRIARRRAEIVEADMRTLLDGDNVNWARKVLDKSIKVTWTSITTSQTDTIRNSHSETRTTKISLGFPSTVVDTIRANPGGVDLVRERSSWNPTGLINVETTHIKPLGK